MNNLHGKYIGVIVPSNYPTISEELLKQEQKDMITNGVKTALEIGFTDVVFSPDVIGNKKYNKATPEDRVKDFEYFLKDENCGGIISLYGGETSVTLTPFIDYELCKNNSKLIMGFSDSATFLNAIAYRSNIKVIYGIDFMWGFGKFLIENRELFDLYKGFLSEGKSTDLELIPIRHDSTEISGKLFGGCLTSFAYSIGTGYNPLDGIAEDFLLVIEDIGITLEKLIALLTQVKLQKNFKYCKGIIFGNFMNSTSKIIEKSIEDIVTEIFDSLPIFKSNDIGHGVYNHPTILGANLIVDSNGTKLRYI